MTARGVASLPMASVGGGSPRAETTSRSEKGANATAATAAASAAAIASRDLVSISSPTTTLRLRGYFPTTDSPTLRLSDSPTPRPTTPRLSGSDSPTTPRAVPTIRRRRLPDSPTPSDSPTAFLVVASRRSGSFLVFLSGSRSHFSLSCFSLFSVIFSSVAASFSPPVSSLRSCSLVSLSVSRGRVQCSLCPV